MTVAPLSSVTTEAIRDLSLLIRELRSNVEETSVTAENIQEVLDDKNAVLMVAKDNERIIGMAALYILPKLGKRNSIVEDVFVLEEYRGQGIGEKLMLALIDEARKRKATSISLTSRPSRIVAHKLYEKLGFIKRETDSFRLLL